MAKRAAKKVTAKVSGHVVEIGHAPVLSKPKQALIVRAHECLRKKGIDTNESTLVDFALSKEGAFVRPLFPFDDVKGSARKYWLHLARTYLRVIRIVSVGADEEKPTVLRLFHPDSDGNSHSLPETAQNEDWKNDVLNRAKMAVLVARQTLEDKSRALNDPRLLRAIEHLLKAEAELS